MRRFALTRAAERDLDQIRMHLLQQAGPRVARLALKEIRNALSLVAAQPGIGHLHEDLTPLPVKFWLVYSYLIIYKPETKPLQILRILHGMRDVGDILH